MKKEYLDDTEMAKFHRVSVRTVVKSVKRSGRFNGIEPKYFGNGNKRKFRMWSVDAVAKTANIEPERVVAAVG